MIPVGKFSSHVDRDALRLVVSLEKPRTVKNVIEWCCSDTPNFDIPAKFVQLLKKNNQQ